MAAAILTPPDVITQIGLAIPTLVLYEISILCVSLVEKKAKEANAETAGLSPDDDDEPDDGGDAETPSEDKPKDTA